jgi:quinoprotein glucose dehydrogenase
VIDFTPAIHDAALVTLKRYRTGPLFTPPSVEGTVTMPGAIGGVGWGGGAYDPETNTLYVKASNSPALWRLARRETPSDTVDADWMADLQHSSLSVRMPDSIGGGDLPINKPPYGTLTAIDLATGERRWQVTLGDSPELRAHPALKGLGLAPLGVSGSPGGMVTKGGLVFLTGGGSTLFAIDTRDGKTRWQADLGQRGYANPMTYRTSAGRQFVVVASGGGAGAKLAAFALP